MSDHLPSALEPVAAEVGPVRNTIRGVKAFDIVTGEPVLREEPEPQERWGRLRNPAGVALGGGGRD